MTRKFVLSAGALALATLALLGLLVWRLGAPRRAVLDLPVAERRAYFSREIEGFRTLCGAGPRTDVLEGRCREQAEFLLQFPECDDACRELMRSHLGPESPR